MDGTHSITSTSGTTVALSDSSDSPAILTVTVTLILSQNQTLEAANVENSLNLEGTVKKL